MAYLELRKDSKWWYGVYQRNNKRRTISLKIEVAGQRPPTTADTGDAAFEQSRGRANAALDQFLRKLDEGGQEEELAKNVYKARYSRELKVVSLASLPEYWERIPRKRAPSPRYRSQCRSTIQSFIDWLKVHHPSVTDVAGVSADMAETFMASEEQQQVTARTWNERLTVLKGLFGRLRRQTGIGNPFTEIVSRDVDTVYRIPFNAEELRDVLQACAADPLIAPLAITAACTAMRLGDCCMLQWTQVDLAEGFITVKTSKTGVTVDIPIFPMLLDELVARRHNGSIYAFPEQAAQYQKNQSLLSSRLRKALSRARFHDNEQHMLTAALIAVDDVKAAAAAMFSGMPASERTSRMGREFDEYISGLPLKDVAKKIGVSQSIVSRDLNEIETRIEIPFIRGKVRQPLTVSRGQVSISREKGRKASTRDWHSFRTTWITLALIGNIPLELVKRVTGHKTVDVVMRHYFRPQREQLKTALMSMMPKLLVNGTASSSDQVLLLLETALVTDSLQDYRANIQAAILLLRGGV